MFDVLFLFSFSVYDTMNRGRGVGRVGGEREVGAYSVINALASLSLQQAYRALPPLCIARGSGQGKIIPIFHMPHHSVIKTGGCETRCRSRRCISPVRGSSEDE